MSRWLHLRQMGATARAMLIVAAGTQWSVSRDEITTERSVVKHAKTNRTLSYGALADSLARITPPSDSSEAGEGGHGPAEIPVVEGV